MTALAKAYPTAFALATALLIAPFIVAAPTVYLAVCARIGAAVTGHF